MNPTEFLRQDHAAPSMSARQGLPVRVYQTRDRIMLAAPMPGLEPGNISVHISEDGVTIHGEERGPHQHERNLLLAEWSVGPYHRKVTLPHPVNGVLTNATYGNGILVVAMPKMPPDQHGVSAQLRLEAIGATRGERVGHVGRVIQPVTTGEHRWKRHETIRSTRPAGSDAETPKATSRVEEDRAFPC
jgi:HSP20 family protein